MASYTDAKIYIAFGTRLGTLATTPALPVLRGFVPRQDRPSGGYIHCKIMPVTTRQASLGDDGMNSHVGIFQLTVFRPDFEPDEVGLDLAGAVAAHFKRGTDLMGGGETIRVYRPPEISGPLSDEPFSAWAVSVRYRVFASNPS